MDWEPSAMRCLHRRKSWRGFKEWMLIFTVNRITKITYKNSYNDARYIKYYYDFGNTGDSENEPISHLLLAISQEPQTGYVQRWVIYFFPVTVWPLPSASCVGKWQPTFAQARTGWVTPDTCSPLTGLYSSITKSQTFPSLRLKKKMYLLISFTFAKPLA